MAKFVNWILLCHLLVILAIVWCSNIDCPSGCDSNMCQCTETEMKHILVTCDGLTEQFFACLNDSVEELQLHRSSLASISAKDFENAKDLERLDISGNENFTKIETGALVGLVRLRHLYLDHNALSDLEERIFPLSVEELRLNNNNISKIDVEAVFEQGQSKLQLLTLSHNKLEDFRCPASKDLIVLELHGNRLTSIKNDHFENCANVQELHLAGNRIRDVEINWSVIPGLIFLDLRYNAIEHLGKEFHTSLKALRYLLAARNELEDLPELPPSLIGLDLNGNPVEVIRTATFRNLTKLSYVELSDMSHLRAVEEDAFVGTVSLFSLKLQNNRNLHFLPERTWSTSAILQEIHLSNSGITIFHRGLFSTLEDLRVAVIAGNPLDCSCDAAWIREDMESPEDNEWIRPWINGTEAVICQSPENVKDFRVSKLNPSDLTCEKAIMERNSTTETSTAVILEAMLSRGVPSTSWFLPDGRHIIAHRNEPQILNAQSDPVAEEFLLANMSVIARLTIFTTNFDPGPYVLQSTNAAGPLNHTFLVESGPQTPIPAPGGGPSGGTIAIVVIVSIVAIAALGVAGFFAFRYFRSRRENRYQEVDE